MIEDDDYEDLVPIDEDAVPDVELEEKKISVFDLFDDISQHGKFLDTYFSINGKLPKEYNVYMLNKAFANFPDTVLLVNELNKYYDIPNEMHWRFLKNSVEKRKRYSKWFKKLEDEEPIEMLAKYFKCSVREMQKNINFMPKEKQIEILHKIAPEKYKTKSRKQYHGD